MVTPHIATGTAHPVLCSTPNGNSRAALQAPYPHSRCSAQTLGKMLSGLGTRLGYRDVLLLDALEE